LNASLNPLLALQGKTWRDWSCRSHRLENTITSTIIIMMLKIVAISQEKCDYLDTYHDPLQAEFEQYLHICMIWLIYRLQRCVFWMEICMYAVSVMGSCARFVSLVHASMWHFVCSAISVKIVGSPPLEQVSLRFVYDKCYGKLLQGCFCCLVFLHSRLM
jgi:hypothetical protein